MRKITTLLTLLLIAVGASAQSWTIDVNPSNGTFYRRDYTVASSSQWAGIFVSNVSGAPAVTITASVGGTVQHKFATTRDGISTEPNGTVNWSIAVEDGYVVTGWTLEGATNGGECVVTPNTGAAVTFTTAAQSVGASDLAVQNTGFTVTAGSGDRRINFSKFQIKVAKTYEVIVDMSTGDLYRSGAINTGWSSQWISQATDPQVSVTASANNMEPAANLASRPSWSDGTEVDYRSGYPALTSTYTVSCTDPFYVIAGSFTGAALTDDQTVTVEGNSHDFTTTEETFNFPVDSRARSFSFVLSGPNTGLFGKMKVVMMKPSTVDVTYNLYYNGVLKGSETVASELGFAPVLPASLEAPFMDYTYDVTEITNTTTEVNVTATWNGPFEFAADYDHIHWYFMTLKSAYSVAYVASGTDNVQTPSSRDNSHMYQWGFVGDPFSGFTIYNREAGSGLVFGSATHDKEASGNSGASTHVNMKASGTQDEELWHVKASSFATNGFFLLNTHNQALNWREVANLAYWVNGMDAGSTFVVTDAENFYDQVMSNIKPAYDNAGKYFYITVASAAPMQSIIDQVVSTNYCSQSDYEALEQMLQNAEYLYPETGYYRFKSSGARTGETYLAYGSDAYYGMKGLVTVPASQKPSDLSTVFKLTKVGDNQYTLSTQGLDVQTVSQNNKVFPLGEGNATVFSFIMNAGKVAIKDINNSDPTVPCLHETNWGSPAGVVRWTETSDASQWTVEEAGEVSVAMHVADDGWGYATFYAPFDATFTNVTAYTITKGAAIAGVGSEALMREVSGAVPAGTPVVLVDETGTVAAATANVSYGAAALGFENILSGHYLASKVADGSLVFGQYNSTPGFYRYDDYSTVLGANRAFIAPAQANNVRAFVFVSPETGISTTLFNKQNGSTYDLQGRRVQNAQKGIYILNGKKVLVK